MTKKIVSIIVSLLVGLLLANNFPQFYFYGCLGLIGLAFVLSWSPHRFQAEESDQGNQAKPAWRGYFPWITLGYILAGVIKMLWQQVV